MLDYEKQLEDIRDKIANVSPDKWIGDESDYSECSNEEEFEIADLTPIKGSISKIERKRRVFDMMKVFNETLQSKFKLAALKKF